MLIEAYYAPWLTLLTAHRPIRIAAFESVPLCDQGLLTMTMSVGTSYFETRDNQKMGKRWCQALQA